MRPAKAPGERFDACIMLRVTTRDADVLYAIAREQRVDLASLVRAWVRERADGFRVTQNNSSARSVVASQRT